MFIGILAGFWKGPRTGAILGASAIAAALAKLYVPGAWYIVIGGLVGVLVAAAPPQGRRSVHDGDDPGHSGHGACDLCDARQRALSHARRGGEGAAEGSLDALPPAILMAVIAPTILTTGWRESTRGNPDSGRGLHAAAAGGHGLDRRDQRRAAADAYSQLISGAQALPRASVSFVASRR